MSKEYLLTFNQIIENINKFELGTIIESEYGDKYKLTKTDTDTRKFSRIDNGLRFMTYDNLNRFFRIIKEQEEIDIQSIEEINLSSTPTKYEVVLHKLVQAVKQLDKKIKEK